MRKGAWIQTYTGRQFYPLDPRPEDIDPLDIVASLSRQCRFTGHTRSFYSVAQHSILVADHVPVDMRLWALLHDASEAYLCDLPRPLKRQPEFKAYREAETRVQACVCERFGLPVPEPEAVRLADLRMLATEARDLMPNKPAEWDWMPPPFGQRIIALSSDDAARLFADALTRCGIRVVQFAT